MEVKQDGLTYLIEEKEKKAEIIGYYEDRENFLIPRSIKHESQEYIVINISKYAFKCLQNIKSITFSLDSELQTIDEEAFLGSSIESIIIPPHVTKICKSAFFKCKKLQQIDIPSNSELQTIEQESFEKTSIESIFIPPHVTKICKCTFFKCKKFQQIDIPSNSELQIIEQEAFAESSIKNIFIPASLIDLNEGWCISLKNLISVKVDPRNSRYSYLDEKMIICKSFKTKENYDEIVFCRRDVKEIKIPSFIKTIGSNAFEYCEKIQRIDIPSNSELQIIKEKAFSFSSIRNIFIPPHVTRICEYAFSYCDKLQRIDIPSNSELQTIDNEAFLSSSIESIFIPHHVTKINFNAFPMCYELNLIEIDENSKMELYDICFIFKFDAIVMIPVK